MQDSELSVVIVVGDEGTRSGLKRTMQSLLNQRSLSLMEILIVDCSAPGTPPLEGSDHPNVRTIKMPREQTTMAAARAAGVRQAGSPLVAFLDEHSFAMAGWAEALIHAHEGPWAGVSGEIYNLSSAVGVADAMYIMGHGRWVPPVERKSVDLLPSHDTCYKREILLEYANDLELLLMAEPVLMWKLKEDGYELLLDPDVKSLHGYTANMLTLVAFYAWNRCFGYARARVFKWSSPKRWLHALLAPVIPWARAFQIGRMLVKNAPERLWVYITGLPFILLAQYAASFGEAMGYIFGKGNAEILFTQTHLRGLRWFPEIP